MLHRVLLLLALATVPVHLGPTRASSCSATLELFKVALLDNSQGDELKNYTATFRTGLRTHVSNEEIEIVTQQIMDAMDAVGEELVSDFDAKYHYDPTFKQMKDSAHHALLHPATIVEVFQVSAHSRKQAVQVFLVCGKHVLALPNRTAEKI